uniref:Uncharacterized protein n=1 Tax=Ciona intestinalis TaxID=7719 RepID=H2Y368_CIOIN
LMITVIWKVLLNIERYKNNKK